MATIVKHKQEIISALRISDMDALTKELCEAKIISRDLIVAFEDPRRYPDCTSKAEAMVSVIIRRLEEEQDFNFLEFQLILERKFPEVSDKLDKTYRKCYDIIIL